MILILREEIVCAVIMLFLIFYYTVNKVKDKEMLFLKLCVYALIHVIFDIITVITVNHQDIVPDFINRIMHIGFYAFSMLFIITFFHYVLRVSTLYKYAVTLKRISYIPLYLFMLTTAFLPVEYVDGRGTFYSYGPLVFIGYGFFMLYCAASLFLLLYSRKELDSRTKHSLIPMIFAMCALIGTQAVIPELLITSGGVTFVCLGIFVALDNPDKDLHHQALWDYATGLKNKNCYTRDLESCTHLLQKKKLPPFAFVVADMNHLKLVNDTYGHAEGDAMIAAAADVLKNTLLSAEAIYRLGGDEFTAIYLNPDEATIHKELQAAHTLCKTHTDLPVPLSIALGYAIRTEDEPLTAVFERADQDMYKKKQEMKRNGLAIERPNS